MKRWDPMPPSWPSLFAFTVPGNLFTGMTGPWIQILANLVRVEAAIKFWKCLNWNSLMKCLLFGMIPGSLTVTPGNLPSLQGAVANRWFIGALNGSLDRDFKIPLDFLSAGLKYEATLYYDDPDAGTITRVGISKTNNKQY